MKIKNSNLTWWDDIKEKIDILSYPITIITGLAIKLVFAVASIIIIIIAIIMIIKTLTN